MSIVVDFIAVINFCVSGPNCSQQVPDNQSYIPASGYTQNLQIHVPPVISNRFEIILHRA